MRVQAVLPVPFYVKPTHKPDANLLKGDQPSYYCKPMDEPYDDFLCSVQRASGKDEFLKLPHFQMNLEYNFDGITHLDLPGRTIIKLGSWSPTSATHYNYARRLLDDLCGFRELMSNKFIDGRGATH